MSTGRRRAELAARAAAVAGSSGSRTDQPRTGQDRADRPPADQPGRDQAGRDQAGRDQAGRDQADPLVDQPSAPPGPDRAEPESPPGAPPAPGRAPRTRPVRVTVELSPMEHRALRRWCAETSAELDLPVVAGAEVFRALLGLMQSRPEVAEQVRAELARTGGSRRRN